MSGYTVAVCDGMHAKVFCDRVKVNVKAYCDSVKIYMSWCTVTVCASVHAKAYCSSVWGCTYQNLLCGVVECKC